MGVPPMNPTTMDHTAPGTSIYAAKEHRKRKDDQDETYVFDHDVCCNPV